MKKLFAVLLVAFILIQFFKIDQTNPPVNKGMDFLNTKNPPENIAQLIRTSCYDCHSNETVYPWYSNYQPMGWLLQNHIKEGRLKLNFSTFATYDQKRAAHKLDEASEMLEKREMPLDSYFIGHQDAKLTDAQRAELAAYFKRMSEETARIQ